MANKPKRKMSENSLKNLEKGNLANKTPSERKEIARKGAEKTNQMRAAKIKRENAKEWLWNEYGLTLSEEVLKCGSVKDKLELLKAILPTDKQTNEIIGSVGVQKIFVTPEMQKEAEEETKKLLDNE